MNFHIACAKISSITEIRQLTALDSLRTSSSLCLSVTNVNFDLQHIYRLNKIKEFKSHRTSIVFFSSFWHKHCGISVLRNAHARSPSVRCLFSLVCFQADDSHQPRHHIQICGQSALQPRLVCEDLSAMALSFLSRFITTGNAVDSVRFVLTLLFLLFEKFLQRRRPGRPQRLEGMTAESMDKKLADDERERTG